MPKERLSPLELQLIRIRKNPSLNLSQSNLAAAEFIRRIKDDGLQKQALYDLARLCCIHGWVYLVQEIAFEFEASYYGWGWDKLVRRFVAPFNHVDILLLLLSSPELPCFRLFKCINRTQDEVYIELFRYNFVDSIYTLLEHGIPMFKWHDHYATIGWRQQHVHRKKDYEEYLAGKLSTFQHIDWNGFFGTGSRDDKFKEEYLMLIYLPLFDIKYRKWKDEVRRPRQRKEIESVLHSLLPIDIIRYAVGDYI